jgi:hypothetical protein
MAKWTTKIPDDIIKSHGHIGEIHNVFFLPKDWPGEGGPVVSMLIPECETQYCVIKEAGPFVTVDRTYRPTTKEDIWRLLQLFCRKAVKEKAAVIFSCDTHQQAEATALLATTFLTTHERVALERMMEGKGARENLS